MTGPEKIRAWRTAKSLTLRDAAQRIGISHGAINQIELGNSKTKHSTAVLIAKAMRVSVKQIQDIIE